MYVSKVVIIPIGLILCFWLGWSSLSWLVDNNRYIGYHCQPITEHKTLESAKAQVSVYHAMVRG